MFENVRSKNPLIHNITNYVTVNDCANIVMRDLLGYSHQEQTTTICQADRTNNKGV